MSQKILIITLMSKDRPGIVNQVADIVEQHNGNWLDSHMVQLAGQFAGLLTVRVTQNQAIALQQALQSLTSVGIKTLIDTAEPTSIQAGNKVNFELSGPDRTGIISEISKAFSGIHTSIDVMKTECSSTPWTGEPLFEASGTLLIPEDMDIALLQDQLASVEDKLGIDISLVPSNDDEILMT